MRRLRPVTAFLALCAATPLFAGEQIVVVDPVPVGAPVGSPVTITIGYSTAGPVDETLTGLGLRLHYDADALILGGLEAVFAGALEAEAPPAPDWLDLDGDPETDTFVHLAWADPAGTWPGIGTTPLTLLTAEFVVAPGFDGSTRLGISASSTAAGYALVPGLIFDDGFESGGTGGWSSRVGDLMAPPGGSFGPAELTARLTALAGEPAVLGELGLPLLDIDGDGLTFPETDGSLVLRWLFGFRGAALIDGAVGAGATRTTASELEDYLADVSPALDVDLDGRRDALTDGLLVVRFLAGFLGPALVDGVLGPNATRTDPGEVFGYLSMLDDPEGEGDTDGDGVSDLDEVVGYQILIDFDGLGLMSLGWENSLTPRWVTSDPLLPDTDGDGLGDRDELLFRTDPRDDDTDLDGITDPTELFRYASAPASVDSDGDSRGPGGGGTPNPLLFDGNELALYGSSPALADTDGDARTDFEEANQNGTPPLIADVPRLVVELVGDVTVDLEYTSTVTNETRMLESTLVGQSDTSGQSTTDTTSSQWSIGASATVTAGVEAGFPGGASASAEVSVTVSGEYSEETTSSFTEDSSTTVQNEFQESQETARSTSEEISGGALRTGIRIRNVGDVAFTLSDLAATAIVRDPVDRGSFDVVGTLIPALPGGEVTLGPFNGQTGVLEVSDDDVSTGIATSLLADPAGLYLDVASFALEDAEGRNFAFLAEVTNARTALLTIDFGNGEVERYRVATMVERNPDGTGAGVALGDVLTRILGIPFATAPRTGSTDPEFPDGVSLLTRVRGVETAIDPVPANHVNSFWAVLSDDPEITGEPGVPFTVDFEDLVLLSGDTVSLTYITDADRDGLFRREEFLYRTTDVPLDFNGDGVIDAGEEARSLDFDQDQLGDFVEVRTGWTVGPSQRRVHPDPTSADTDRFDRDGDGLSDGDGLGDLTEFRGRDGCGPHHPADPGLPDPACGGGADTGDATDPTTPDTDGDGLNDAEDNDPLNSLNTPPLIALTPSFEAATGILTLTGTVTDATDPIDFLVIEWGDGTLTCLDNDGGPGCEPVDYDALSVVHQYLSTGSFTVVAEGTDVRPSPGVPASSTATYGPFDVVFPDDPEALYFFTDGSLTDLTGNGHDGTIAGTDQTRAETTIDRFGSADDAYCLRSDQLDQCAYIELDHVPFDDQLTFAAWILRDRLQGMIVGQWDVFAEPDVYARLFFSDSNSDVTFEIADGTDQASVRDPNPPPRQSADAGQCGASSPLADWRLYVATVAYDGADTTIRLYRGAGGGSAVTLVEELVVPGVRFTNPSTTDVAQIGGSMFGPDQDCGADYQGRIDDVRIYSRALSVPEINALLNEVQGP